MKLDNNDKVEKKKISLLHYISNTKIHVNYEGFNQSISIIDSETGNLNDELMKKCSLQFFFFQNYTNTHNITSNELKQYTNINELVDSLIVPMNKYLMTNSNDNKLKLYEYFVGFEMNTKQVLELLNNKLINYLSSKDNDETIDDETINEEEIEFNEFSFQSSSIQIKQIINDIPIEGAFSSQVSRGAALDKMSSNVQFKLISSYSIKVIPVVFACVATLFLILIIGGVCIYMRRNSEIEKQRKQSINIDNIDNNNNNNNDSRTVFEENEAVEEVENDHSSIELENI
jgi:hypothetical protein